MQTMRRIGRDVGLDVWCRDVNSVAEIEGVVHGMKRRARARKLNVSLQVRMVRDETPKRTPCNSA